MQYIRLTLYCGRYGPFQCDKRQTIILVFVLLSKTNTSNTMEHEDKHGDKLWNIVWASQSADSSFYCWPSDLIIWGILLLIKKYAIHSEINVSFF